MSSADAPDKLSCASELTQQLEQTLATQMKSFIGQKDDDVTRALIQSRISDTMQEIEKNRELDRLLADVKWLQRLRELLSKKIRGEDLNPEEFKQVRSILLGMQLVEEIPEMRKRQYKTLLHRMQNGEELMFLDYHLLETLRYDLGNLRTSHARVKFTDVKVEGTQIRATMEVTPASPSQHITITITPDQSLCDQVVGKQIIPHEAIQEATEAVTAGILHDIEDMLQEKMERRIYADRSRRMNNITRNMKLKILPFNKLPPLNFTVSEQLGSATFNPKALAKVAVS